MYSAYMYLYIYLYVKRLHSLNHEKNKVQKTKNISIFLYNPFVKKKKCINARLISKDSS